MAIESIQDRIFTPATDIWSFGVVIWEIFNGGATPYAGLSNTEILLFLQSGGRLKKTETVPPVFANLMKLCWLEVPSDRPSSDYIHEVAKQIHIEIEGFYASVCRSPSCGFKFHKLNIPLGPTYDSPTYGSFFGSV